MTVFLLVAALLLAAAMMFVMPPLLGKKIPGTDAGARNDVNLAVLRDQLHELDTDLANGIIDQDGYASARAELERRVASDVLTDRAVRAEAGKKPLLSLLIGMVVPAVAISLYFLLGTPDGLAPGDFAVGPDQTPAQIAKMVSRLEQKLKSNPTDPDGWNMLARSYYAMGRYRDSANAYARLVQMVPDNADVLVSYADALAMAQNKTLLGEPEKMIDKALSIDPKNISALALSGSAAFEKRDFHTAASQWKKILALVDPDTDTARSIASNINEAETLAGDGAPAAPADKPADKPTDKPAVTAQAVEGQVTIDARLLSKAGPDDTVFIFARASEGPRFPLAVLRKQVKDLPVNFRLDDTMGMMPNVKLSDFPLVVVGARISKSGSATPAAGDLEGLSKPVKPGATGVKIVIDTQRN